MEAWMPRPGGDETTFLATRVTFEFMDLATCPIRLTASPSSREHVPRTQSFNRVFAVDWPLEPITGFTFSRCPPKAHCRTVSWFERPYETLGAAERKSLMEVPNKFQVILSETPRPDLLESERQRAEIERFIGRYMVDWGYVEFFMNMSINAWVTPRSLGNLQRAILTQSTSSKINFIRGLLPETWVSGAAIIRHLEDGNQYRNSLAHSNLAMGGFDGERQRGWHLWNVRGRAIRLDLPEEERSDRLARVSVLRQAVGLLMHDEIRSVSGDLNQVSLSSLIVQQPGTWHTWEEWGHFTRIAREMFPESGDHK